MADATITFKIKLDLDMSPEDQARIDYLIEMEKRRQQKEQVPAISVDLSTDVPTVIKWFHADSWQQKIVNDIQGEAAKRLRQQEMLDQGAPAD